MSWSTWWLFAATCLVLDLTPGPAVLYVLSSALRAGARRSLASILAILSANSVYFAISATGVGALLLSSYRLFFAVKWAGAAYLVFLGIRTFAGHKSVVPCDAVPCDDAVPRGTSARRLFLDGFVVQMSNPKAILFFTAFLPQFIEPRRPLIPQVAILGVTSIMGEFAVLGGYALAAARASALARQPRYALWTNRISGSLLIGAGAGLAALRRT
jgi:threonine/homoserine/homoserine lactone efflux protein